MKGKSAKILNIAVPILTIAAIAVFWLVAALCVGERLILPMPHEALREFFLLFGKDSFYTAFFSTMLRSLIAFVLSFAFALVLAACAARYRTAERIAATLVPIIRALPTIAVVLLLVLWTSSRTAAVTVTMLVVFPTLYTNAVTALKGIDGELAEMCRVYGIDKKTRIFKIYLPAVLPPLIIAAGAGFALNLKLMVAAEVLAQTANGLGILMNEGKIYFETARLMALVLVAVVTGLAVEAAARGIAKKAVAKYA